MSADMELPEQQSTVYVFDFDGVICDSVGENILTTWRAAAPADMPRKPPADLEARFRACRPVIETGHQNIPLLHLLLQGYEVEQILSGFDQLLQDFLTEHGQTEADSMAAFGKARAAWQAEDPEDWFSAQGFYAHAIAPVNRVADRAVIATTKQHESACRLVTRAGLEIPLARVYGMERLGPQKKRNVLEAVLERNPQAQVHFFEDRIATLHKMTDLPRLELHLVDWGYNLPEERAQAAGHARMDLLSADEFAAMLQG